MTEYWDDAVMILYSASFRSNYTSVVSLSQKYGNFLKSLFSYLSGSISASIASHSVNTKENIVKQRRIDAKRVVHGMKWAADTCTQIAVSSTVSPTHSLTETTIRSRPQYDSVRSGQRNSVFAFASILWVWGRERVGACRRKYSGPDSTRSHIFSLHKWTHLRIKRRACVRLNELWIIQNGTKGQEADNIDGYLNVTTERWWYVVWIRRRHAPWQRSKNVDAGRAVALKQRDLENIFILAVRIAAGVHRHHCPWTS